MRERVEEVSVEELSVEEASVEEVSVMVLVEVWVETSVVVSVMEVSLEEVSLEETTVEANAGKPYMVGVKVLVVVTMSSYALSMTSVGMLGKRRSPITDWRAAILTEDADGISVTTEVAVAIAVVAASSLVLLLVRLVESTLAITEWRAGGGRGDESTTPVTRAIAVAVVVVVFSSLVLVLVLLSEVKLFAITEAMKEGRAGGAAEDEGASSVTLAMGAAVLPTNVGRTGAIVVVVVVSSSFVLLSLLAVTLRFLDPQLKLLGGLRNP